MTVFRYSISMCCLIMVMALGTPSFGEEKATLCYEDEDYAPYLAGKDAAGEIDHPGVLVELTRTAFESQGFSVEFVRRPWKRCLHMVNDGVADGMFGVIYLQDRETLGVFPKKDGEVDTERRLLNVEYPIFYNKLQQGKLGWDGENFISTDVKIGTPLGYATVTTLEEKHQISPNTAYLPEDGLRLVSQNKLDGYIVEKNVGNSLLRKHGLDQFVAQHTLPFKKVPLYLMLSYRFYEKSPQKAENVWTELAVLRKTVLDEMMKRYMQMN